MISFKEVSLAALLLTLSPLSMASKETVEVSGSCSVKVTPDLGSVTLFAENQAKDQKIAFQKTNEQISKLKEKISSLGLKDLVFKNKDYQVFPVREYERERMVDKGTKVSLALDVQTSDVARLGEVMAIGVQVGISNVGSLQTMLSPEKFKTEQSKCLELASDDAKAKAKILAKKFGTEIDGVKSIVELSPSDQSSPHLERAYMKSDSAAPQIEGGEQTFSSSLRVTFLLK